MYFCSAVKKLIKEILPVNLKSQHKNIYQNFKQIQMKKIFSTSYSAGSFNIAMLLLRLGVGILMLNHGYDKLIHFGKYQGEFIDFMGMGQKISLSLCVFAEFFCSALLIIGLFTRLATIPLIINMCVIIFKVLGADVLGKGESAALYLVGFLVILMVGPGKASVDGMIGK